MKNTLSRRDRRALRRAHDDHGDAAPESPPDAGTSRTPPHRPGTAPFDPAEVAADVAAGWIGRDGRRRYMIAADGLLAPVLPSGKWLPAGDRDVVLDLQLAAVKRGHRLLPPRLDAARAELYAILWDDGPELLPHVDAEALCAPARPHGPPGNWVGAGDGRGWVAEYSYGELGRYVAIWNGQGFAWQDGAWQQRPGDDDWLIEIIEPGLGRLPDSGMTAEVRRALTIPFTPADPGEVAAHDHHLAVAEVVGDERRAIDGRRNPHAHRTHFTNWMG